MSNKRQHKGPSCTFVRCETCDGQAFIAHVRCKVCDGKGGKLGRLDIPEGEGFITQFFGASSVYRITIVTEQVARNTTKQTTPAPVSPWDYPKQLTQGVARPEPEYLGRGDDGSDLEP